jgi:hypothetical protein
LGPQGLLPSCQLARACKGSYRPSLNSSRRMAAKQQTTQDTAGWLAQV